MPQVPPPLIWLCLSLSLSLKIEQKGAWWHDRQSETTPINSMAVICRLVAFLGVMVLVVGWGTLPASASPPSYGDGLYLENSNTFGLYAKSGLPSQNS